MKTTIINPLDEISKILELNGIGKGLRCSHITYDQDTNENYQYQIIRESSHDGTLLFTMRLFDQVLLPLINKSTYYKGNIEENELKNIKDIHYTIGDMRLETEFGKVNGFPGQTDKVFIPVRCEYEFH